MFAEKLTKVIKFKRWISFKKLDHIIKHISNTGIRNHYGASDDSPQEKFTLKSSQQTYPKSKQNNYYNPVEGAHAYKILRNSEDKAYKTLSAAENSNFNNIESLLNKQWISMSNAEILENLKFLSYYIFKNQDAIDPKYCEILEIIISRCSNFNDDELHLLLNCLEVWNIELYETIHKHISAIIDEECLKRMQNWSIDEMFLFNDHFYKLGMTRSSTFAQNSLKTMLIKNMSLKNLVQYAFLMKVSQRTLIRFDIFEHYIVKYANEMTVEEIGIISMAFFKYEKAIRNKNLQKIFMHKLCENINTASDIALSSILKVLRYSLDLTTVQYYNHLLQMLVSQVSSRSLLTITQFAHMQASILLHNSDLISKILERYDKEISDARLKDIERVSFTLYTFNYDPNTTPFYSTAINELLRPSRNKEIKGHPGSFLYTILYILQANYFSEEAVARVMDPSFINYFCKNDLDNLNREYLVMDYCIEIEHPEYTGPRLKRHLLNVLLKKFGALRKDEASNRYNQNNMLLTDLAHTCKELLGAESSIHIDALLPHFAKKNIIVCYNKETKTIISPAEKLSEIPLGKIKYAPKDGNEWCVLLSGTHNIMTRNTDSPTGILALEMRHLKRIGYTPIVIPFIEWKKLQNNDRKMNYINNVLNI